MGAKSLLFALGLGIVANTYAVTNSVAKQPGYRGVFRIGSRELEGSCSAVLVAKDVEYFYLLTAAHCVSNTTDGGTVIYDPYNNENKSYKSLKVHFPDFYSSDPRYFAALEKEYQIELGLRDHESKEKEKKVYEMNIKLFTEQVKSKKKANEPFSSEENFLSFAQKRHDQLTAELEDADSKLREKVLGPPPDEKQNLENFASLSTEYYDFENDQNNDFSYAMIYQAPDVALLQFSYFDVLGIPSAELVSLIQETPPVVLASAPGASSAVSFVGYEDKLVPSEGHNEISDAVMGKKIDYFDSSYELLSYYGVPHYHYIEGSDPYDYEDPEKFFPEGTNSAIQGGDSGGATFQDDKLRGIICQKSYSIFKKEKILGRSWPALTYDENPDYEVHHSISADLTAPPIRLFLLKLAAMGIPLNF